MRCPKCGYHSFDYLSECGKCHTDLSKVRQELGFSSVRPTMPAWLVSLVKEGPQHAKMDQVGHAEAIDLDDLLQASALAAESVPELSLEDDSIPAEAAAEPIEFQLDDADQTLRAEVGGKSGERAPVPIESPAATAAVPVEIQADLDPPASAEMTIDLSDDLHDWSLLDLQMDEGDGPAASELQEGAHAAERSLAAAPRVKPGKEAKDEAIIELSEEDLEGLLLELENGGKESDKA